MKPGAVKRRSIRKCHRLPSPASRWSRTFSDRPTRKSPNSMSTRLSMVVLSNALSVRPEWIDKSSSFVDNDRLRIGTPYEKGQAGFIGDANLSSHGFLFCSPGKKRRDSNFLGGIDQHSHMGRHREKVL